MALSEKPHGVHFVGSAPWKTPEETFSALSKTLPGRLRRMPDGEPYPRDYWLWRMHVLFPDWSLGALSYSAKTGVAKGLEDNGPPTWITQVIQPPERKPGEKLEMQNAGFDKAAIESYAIFKRMRDEGKIEKGVRFQVSLATPLGVVATHAHETHRKEFEEAYETQMAATLQRIQSEIPHDDLSIQWDLAFEMALLEIQTGRAEMPGWGKDWGWWWDSDMITGMVERLKKWSAAIAPNVELGFHFCYGDIAHSHFVQPLDAALMVKLANLMIPAVEAVPFRKIHFLHFPVPPDREDEAYFEPFKQLKFDKDTELYLGLVREHDLEGTKKRVVTAQKVLPDWNFGVCTECGLGRVALADAESVCEISAAVTDPFPS